MDLTWLVGLGSLWEQGQNVWLGVGVPIGNIAKHVWLRVGVPMGNRADEDRLVKEKQVDQEEFYLVLVGHVWGQGLFCGLLRLQLAMISSHAHVTVSHLL